MPSIEPRTLKGFRDFLPEKQIARQRFIDTIKKSYELFGFDPLETPALEYADILTGKYGEEGDKLMYRFKDNGDRDVALRYDLTIPLARVAAQYGEIKKPFKRYQISPVWRAENTQRGRFREFYQCDADIIGSNSPLADAEVIVLGATALRALNVTEFIFRINHREILKDFYNSLSIDTETQLLVLREVDKIDKIGKDGVIENLEKLNLSKEVSEAIVEFAGTRIESLDDVSKTIAKYPALQESFSKLQEIISNAMTLDSTLPWIIDFSIARGLDYYTGMILETTLTKLPGIGSVFSGGRYDNLIGMFGNKQIPAVGASIGLDRLYAALEELGVVKEERTVTSVLVTNFDSKFQSEYLKIVSELRAANINASLFFDTAEPKKQFVYAEDRKIKFVIVYGEDEAKEGKITIKDLEKGSQTKVDRDQLVKSLN
ncbi:MAG: histidine--tRNA ligase [bacterium]